MSWRKISCRVLSIVAVTTIAVSVCAEAQVSGSTYAIGGATIYTLAGEPIEGGTVVIQDGRITAVGMNVTVPAGATRIDAAGLQVYPGLFNAYSQLGLQEINAVTVTNDVRELGNFNPQLQAATAVHPASERIPVTRANGVTHVVAAPSTGGGGIAGRASAIHLDGWTVEEMLIESSVGMVLNWPSIQTRSFSFQTFQFTNRSYSEAQEEYEKAVGQLEDWLEDARRYARAVESGSNRRRDLKLESMGPVIAGELPVLVLADAERDIRNALEFAEEQGLKMVLVSGRDAWKVADLLAEKDVPVLMRATQNMPTTADDAYDETFTAAATLHEAGVRFAMTGYGSSGPNPPSRTLAYEAANAVPYGLPWEEALKSITRYPAEILGLGDELGTIEEGKIANLIVTDGDPMLIQTQILHVFIKGEPVSLDNKHKALYEKYRARN